MTKIRLKILTTFLFTWALLTKLAFALNFTPTTDTRVTTNILDTGDCEITFNENQPSTDESLKIINIVHNGPLSLKVISEFCTAAIPEIDSTTAGTTLLYLDESLDYEIKNCQSITVQVEADVDNKFIYITLQNVDDNPPQMLPSECKMKENSTSEFCSYTLIDVDGFIDKTNLSIMAAGNKEDEIFLAEFEPHPNSESHEATIKLSLQAGKVLDYETLNVYIFSLMAVDSGNNNNTLVIVINVVDLPDQPPRFTQIFYTQEFEENTAQSFTVVAIDGDLGIHNAIKYALLSNDECKSESISIEETKGIISVEPIDRDVPGHDTIQVCVEAIEVGDESSTAVAKITFFIKDVDDNIPKITTKNTESDTLTTSLDENSKVTNIQFHVNDPDLADFGTYDVMLVDDLTHGINEAFQVIPTKGYQAADFILSVLDSTKLDYENPEWKTIKFKIVTKESKYETKTDVLNVIINLNDLNDEPPKFDDETDSVTIEEDVESGTKVFSAHATDKDEGDVVKYEILGIWSKKLNIEQVDGIITTKVDNTFDYESQQQVIVQIQATDKDEKHVTIKTLQINVLDVDDETPRIQIGNAGVEIAENVPIDTPIDVEIIASDPDTNPDLEFSIDWTNSKVTKNSVVPPQIKAEEWQCIIVMTEEGENVQNKKGNLKISEKCQPDFEKYDTMYISLSVVDKNTKHGIDHSTGIVVINIIDENDNPPQFVSTSLEKLFVADGAQNPTPIGTIIATDPDMDSNITYSISPLDDTPQEWIQIDPNTGALSIFSDATIDDDDPIRETLVFNVTANDSLHVVWDKLIIRLDDINDNPPIISKVDTTIAIDEGLDDKSIITINAKDADRTAPYNTIAYRFDTDSLSNEASDRFAINSITGEVRIHLRNGATLDRDHGTKDFQFYIIAYDNPKGSIQLQDKIQININLNDINNQYPKVTTKTIILSESLKKDDIVSDKIQGEDEDSTPENSKITFEILSLVNSNGNDLKKLFIFKNAEDNSATIQIAENLEGYYGDYVLTILAKDSGTPSLNTSNFVDVTIEKFNFKAPEFKFPDDGTEFLLITDQEPKSQLKMFPDGEPLDNFNVDDNQNKKWHVHFDISYNSETEDCKLFDVVGMDYSEGQLQLKEKLSKDDVNHKCDMTIKASVKDKQEENEAAIQTSCNISVKFVNPSDPPTFTEHLKSIGFNEGNVTNCLDNAPQGIPQASYADLNDDDSKYPKWYFLDDCTPDCSNIFKVDLTKGDVSLIKPLDYEKQKSYNLTIQANSKGIPNPEPNENSLVTIIVNVKQLNMHNPEFSQKKYFGNILKTVKSESEVVKIVVTDRDEGDVMAFSFKEKPKAFGKGIDQITDPFSMNNGSIRMTFSVTEQMSGYFLLSVSVTDKLISFDKCNMQHTNQTDIRIDLITEKHLVSFKFLNSLNAIQSQVTEITDCIDGVLSQYSSAIASWEKISDSETSVEIYFIAKTNNAPVDGDVIRTDMADIAQFSKLQRALLITTKLELSSFTNQDVPVDRLESTLRTWLIGVSSILGTLVILLLIAFILRNRILTQRIKNLSTTKFGSQDSGINRLGIAAPTTNKNALEGSNPVFKHDPEIEDDNDSDSDRASVTSGDSGLIGVEDNPEFDM